MLDIRSSALSFEKMSLPDYPDSVLKQKGRKNLGRPLTDGERTQRKTRDLHDFENMHDNKQNVLLKNSVLERRSTRTASKKLARDIACNKWFCFFKFSNYLTWCLVEILL
jgi:hypothetical protein